MKKIFSFIIFFAALAVSGNATTPLAEKYGSFSIIGDSYSTFMGFTEPLGNAQWYPHAGNAMASVERTWWKLFERESGVRLEQNNSFSGSTICTHSWNNSTDLANSFVGRVDDVRKAGLIIVEGATNDNNAGSGLGSYVWSNFTDSDKHTFRGGTAYVIDFLQKKYPESTIVFMLNSGLRADINNSVQEICDHYNVPVLKLHDITKIDDHPDIAGMMNINKQLMELLCSLEGITYMSEETKVSVSAAKENASVLVDKLMPAGEWTSLCLPFGMNEAQITSAFGEGTQIQGVDAVAEEATVNMVQVTSTEANCPYVVKPGRNVDEPFFVEGVKLEKTSAVAVGEGDVVANGVYVTTSGRQGRNYNYTFDINGALYNNTTSGWSIAPMSVAVRAPRNIVPIGTVQGYGAPALPAITYAQAFTPVNTGRAAYAAVPVIVADPFLSVWSKNGKLSAGVTSHVSGTNHPVEGYIEVDGKFYRFLGAESVDLKRKLAGSNGEMFEAVQKAVHVTATQTFVELEAGGVKAIVVFSSPQLVDDTRSLDAAVNYVSYKTESTDAAEHSVSVHLALASTLVSTSTSNITYTADMTTGVTIGRMGNTTQNMSENARPVCGHIAMMADTSHGQTVDNIGSAYLLFTDNLGTGTSGSGYTVVGRDEGAMAIGFGYARFPAPWTLRYESFGRMMFDMASQVNERLEACRRFDAMIYDDANRLGGAAYADMCRAAYRQVIGACKTAVSDTGSEFVYNFEAGGNNQISQADCIFLAAPLMLAYNPELAYRMYAAVPDYIKMFPGFSSPYGNAPHHLGQWPIMAGSHLDNGVDSTTDLCIVAYAAVAAGMPVDVIDDYSFSYLVSLCEYLDLFTLPQYQNNFPGEGSSDGGIRDNANLRLKSVLAMRSVARIAALRGNTSDEELCNEMAGRWENIFREKYAAGDHYRHGTSVEWGMKYPLFYDRALGFDIFKDVIDTELKYYAAQPTPEYGPALNSSDKNLAKVSATMLTAALDEPSFSSNIAPVAAYFGIGKEADEENHGLLADRYNCGTGKAISGAGTSNLGSIWSLVMLDRLGLSGIESVGADAEAATAVRGIYDLQGRRLSRVTTPGIYIVDGRKTVVR